jgi:hypothetical protein
MESVPDSKAWKHINVVYPEFAFEERSIRLRMVVDGVNPYSNQSLSHSTWPIGGICGWGTTFGTKDLRTMSHWVSEFITIYSYLINRF